MGVTIRKNSDRRSAPAAETRDFGKFFREPFYTLTAEYMKAASLGLAVGVIALMTSPVLQMETYSTDLDASVLRINHSQERESSRPTVLVSTTWWEWNDKDLDFRQVPIPGSVRNRAIESTMPDLAANN